MPENELQHETSPYLLQHGDNPVHWMAWGDPAFARAKAEDDFRMRRNLRRHL